jgi:hypothetical protein
MNKQTSETRTSRINEVKSRTSGAGKGDRPRPITSKYWENYDAIDWSKKSK